MEVVILLMICLISDLSKCVPNKTEDFNIHAPNLITGINQSKILMVKNLTQIKSGITMNVDVSVKI